MSQQQEYVFEFKATLVDHEGFDAEQDAKDLRKAMKGLGTDEAVIIDIVAYRTLRQRLEIESAFKQNYGRDLKEDLKKELGGHFEDTVLAMFYPADERDARFLHKAMHGPGTDEDVNFLFDYKRIRTNLAFFISQCLIEILTTRSSYEIKKIKEAYQEKYNKDLEKAIKDDTSGHFEKFLVILLQANRDHSALVDSDLAKNDAKALYKAGEKFWGTDEEKFNEIFCNRSFPQLRATFKEYEKLTGHSIKKAISKEFSGDLECGLKAIIEIADYLPSYFARKLKHAMEGAGTDDDTLVRIVVTRCEYDMFQIKDEFEKLAGKSLYSWIKDDTSGDYRRMLLRLVGE